MTTDAELDHLEALRAEARKMVRAHVCFGKDGGVERGSVWDNLADTLIELHGRKPKAELDYMVTVMEYAFDEAWPV